jgi:ribonuclease P protein component
VRRNRVRRVFREAFRLALPELPSGLDVVLIATGTEFDPRLEETRAELLELVQRALRRRPRTAPEARPRRGERAR